MASATLLCWFSSDLTRHDSYSNFFARQKVLNMNQTIVRSRGCYNDYRKQNKFFVCAATEGSAKSSKSEETVPSWAKPDSDEPPPWAKGEEGKENSPKQNFEVPFSVYLPASAITAIAAIGSIFEYVNQKPVFGTVNSDSISYAPLLGFFAFTGIPTSEEMQEFSSPLPVLPGLDRLDRLAQAKSVVGTVEAEDQCKNLSSVLEEVQHKGTLMDRLEMLENRV